MPNDLSNAPRRALLAALLLTIYMGATLLWHADRMRLHHDEPIRTMVAQEMLLTGDYLHPTLFQEPYYKKPPFHNWIIAAVSSGDNVVTPREARAVSIVAFLLLCGAVYLAVRPRDRFRATLAWLITLTTYLLLCEYTALAEPDVLLALLTFLAFLVYLRGPCRPGWIALSAALMGLGILTKGVSPLFFYPGVLLHTLLTPEERGRRLRWLALHFVLAWAIPLAWALAMFAGGRLGDLLDILALELQDKTVGSPGHCLGHWLIFPLKAAVVTLPWSLVLVFAFRKGRPSDPVYRMSLFSFGIALILFTIACGSRDRYLVPAIPFFAIAAAYHFDAAARIPLWAGRLIFWLSAAFCLVRGGQLLAGGAPLASAMLLATGGLAVWRSLARQRGLGFALWLALIAFNASTYGFQLPRADRKFDPYPAAVELAERLSPGFPVVAHRSVDLIHVSVHLEGLRQEPVYHRRTAEFDRYYLLTDEPNRDPAGCDLMRIAYPHREVGEIVVQWIDPEDGTSPPPALHPEFGDTIRNSAAIPYCVPELRGDTYPIGTSRRDER